MAANGNLRSCLVLSGGGAHGAYEVGTMLALSNGECPSTHYQPLNADIFCGTSVGAFNAAYMVSQDQQSQATSVESLQKLWLERVANFAGKCGNGVYRFHDGGDWLDPLCVMSHPLEFFTGALGDFAVSGRNLASDTFRVLRSGRPELRTLLDVFDLSAYVSEEPLRKLIKSQIDLDRIARSRVALRVVTTDWTKGETRVLKNSDLISGFGHEAILASTAIPGFFQPVKIEEGVYVDGGVIMNTPLMPAIEAKADVIHMIYLDPDPKHIPLQAKASTLDTMDRMLHILFATKIKEDIATVDWINRGLEVMESVSRGETLGESERRSFVRVAGQLAGRAGDSESYRKIAVHRYFPRTDIQGGMLGYLNFDRRRIEDLIRIGRKDAVEHDCDLNGCLRPADLQPAEETAGGAA